MVKRYLSLVLVEHSNESVSNTNYHWSNTKTIHEFRFFDGMIEITFSDGTITTFSKRETTEMLMNASGYLQIILSMIESRDNN